MFKILPLKKKPFTPPTAPSPPLPRCSSLAPCASLEFAQGPNTLILHQAHPSTFSRLNTSLQSSENFKIFFSCLINYWGELTHIHLLVECLAHRRTLKMLATDFLLSFLFLSYHPVHYHFPQIYLIYHFYTDGSLWCMHLSACLFVLHPLLLLFENGDDNFSLCTNLAQYME